jgi:hypothetical protein
MLVLGEGFPLLIGVAPMHWDTASIRHLTESFEVYFQRGHRYAFVSVQPQGSTPPGASERKLLMQWLASARVRECSSQLCVAAAAVVDNTVMRGALTALLWFWKPPFQLQVVRTPQAGIEHCVHGLEQSGVRLPTDARALGAHATRLLASALQPERSAAQR